MRDIFIQTLKEKRDNSDYIKIDQESWQRKKWNTYSIEKGDLRLFELL